MEDSVLQARYRALLQSARSLFSLSKFDDIIENILVHSPAMMEVEACSLYLPDFTSHELVIYSAVGDGVKRFDAVRIPWDKGIAGLSYQNKEVIQIDDAANDPRVLSNIGKVAGVVPRALLTMPLIDREKCIGVVQAVNPKSGHTFDAIDREILQGFLGVITSALIRLEREQRSTEDARLLQELSLAREIQKSFLPPEKVLFPHAEFRVNYRSARTIGGDFYAAISSSDDRVLVAIGDVSGKGIPAALTTAQITSEMNARADFLTEGLSPWVEHLNKTLYGKFGAGRFAATTFLLYDPVGSTMEVICAGQFPPWRRHENRWEKVQLQQGIPLGVQKDYHYESTHFHCKAGEKWMLFSDGISEGRNENGKEYGLARFAQSLTAGSPYQILTKAWKNWENFVVADHLHDDACLAVLTILPKAKMELESGAENCKHARHFFEGWCQVAGFDDIASGQIVLALDEAFTNVIRHTYKNESHQRVIFNASIDDDFFRVQIRDFGPTLHCEPTKKRELSDIKPGGLGLHFIQQTFSEVEYIPCEVGNELRLARPLGSNGV